MAQTTNAITLRAEYIAISTNGTAFTDISGFSNSVEVGGGDREIGTFFTADGDTPILGAGKRGELEVTLKAVYTEGASDPFMVALSAYEGATDLYARWAPKGNATGNLQYTTSKGIVVSPVYPQGEVQSGDPVAIEIMLKCASITKATIV